MRRWRGPTGRVGGAVWLGRGGPAGRLGPSPDGLQGVPQGLAPAQQTMQAGQLGRVHLALGHGIEGDPPLGGGVSAWTGTPVLSLAARAAARSSSSSIRIESRISVMMASLRVMSAALRTGVWRVPA